MRDRPPKDLVPFVCVFNSWVINHVFIGFKEWYFSQNETTSRPWRKAYCDLQATTNHLKLIFFSKTGNINVFWRVLISLHLNSSTRTSPSDCHMSKINGMEPFLSIICHLLSSKFKAKIRLRLPTQMVSLLSSQNILSSGFSLTCFYEWGKNISWLLTLSSVPPF